MLVTNGGKQAVYEAFATLLDPGDEVLLPAPYWTTYPEAIQLAGGVPVEVVRPTRTSGYLVTVEQLEAARTAAHQGAAVLLAVEPDRRGLPARAGRGDRPLGGRARHLGVTDEIYEHLVYDGATAPSMPVVVPELADRAWWSTAWPRPTR